MAKLAVMNTLELLVSLFRIYIKTSAFIEKRFDIIGREHNTKCHNKIEKYYANCRGLWS